MDSQSFTDFGSGNLVPTIGGCMAFIPAPLPPRYLDLAALVPALERATLALGELSGVGRTIPNPYLLIRPFIRKEAVASSRIEGTVTNLSQLFLFEAGEQVGEQTSDAREVLNYVRALEGALSQLESLPISTRLLRDAHRTLMTGVAGHRGASIVPGEFRKEQNWIGARLIQNARFVPPPHLQAIEAMSDLEKYINAEGSGLPLTIRMALVHYQFEAIHPFPDGNGRVGRLLMPLMLCSSGQLSQPLLYLSSFVEKHYETYIDLMLGVSMRGQWEPWILFFLEGIEVVAKDAITRIKALQDLEKSYLAMAEQARSSTLLARIIRFLFEQPAITIPALSARFEASYNAVKNNVDRLAEQGVLTESGTGWPRIWLAEGIIRIISS